MQARRSGFTLIELMIAVTVVGVLAAIAYPSYIEHIRKGKRATAEAALMDLASKQQTYLLDRRSYLVANAEGDLTAIGFTKPTEISNDYTFTCPAPDCSNTAFKARATPSATLAGQGEQTLYIDNLGAKTPAQSGYWGNR